MAPMIRGRCLRAWLVGVCVWGLTGGCAWRLPSTPTADLQRILERVLKIEDSREKNVILTGALHAKVEEFQSLIERNVILREKILREANRLEDLFTWKRALEPNDLKLVSEGAVKYLELRNELLALVDRYQCLMDYSEEELLRNGVDPRLRLVAVMVSVGAALTLYDNYLTTVIRFEGSSGLRRFVNRGDKSTGLDQRQMEKIGQSARSVINRGQLRGAIMDYEEWKKKYPAWKGQFQAEEDGIDVLDEDFAYLETLIRSSLSYEFVAGVHPAKLSEMKLEGLARALPDLVRDGGDRFLRGLTRVFLKAIALVESREGLLYSPGERRAEALEHLRSILKPGDILLEKAPFRLTDRLVPGYWGHVAIWLGTREELSKLGIWDSPRLIKLRSSRHIDVRQLIEDGHGVIEALRGGVTLNALEHFLNVDDLAVLRPRMNDDPARSPERREAILTALTHVGEQYDYSFDVRTRDRIVCSELAFQSYTQPEFHWPTANVMGRYTISPDQIAIRAIRTGRTEPPLCLIAFYHNGQLMSGSPSELESIWFRLLKVKEYERTYRGRTASGRTPSTSDAKQTGNGHHATVDSNRVRTDHR